MTRRARLPWLLGALALSALVPPAAAGASTGTVAAVLSSELGPYREALGGLQEALGGPVPVFVLTQGPPALPPETKVVVAFGTKAALRAYPARVALVYVLAPGTVIPDAVAVRMEPDAPALRAGLRRLYPGLKRLGVLWTSPRYEADVEELTEAAEPLGITIEGASPEDGDDVPARLRRLYGRVDAIWLPPDPALVNAENLPVLVSFSQDNRIPLFVPTAGLVEQGATASVGASFRELGRLAAAAARAVLQGGAPGGEVQPVNLDIAVNQPAAAKVGLKVPEDTLRAAAKVLP